MIQSHLTTPTPSSYQTISDFFRSGQIQIYNKDFDFSPDRKEASSTLHFISHGYIKAFTIDREGNERILLIYGRGDIFPMLPLVNPSSRDIFYASLTKVKLYSHPINVALDSIFNDLELSNAMIEKLLVQLTSLSDVLENLGYMRANERLVYRLVTLGARFGRRSGNRITIDKLFTHKLVGKTVNLTRETVSREFKKLRQKGLVDTINHEIVINDVHKLHEELGNPISQYLWRILNARSESNIFTR